MPQEDETMPAGTGAMPPSVALDAVKVAYAGPDGTYVAVERVDLVVGRGEFVAIVGPTGCGKSTLLNVAAGLLRPSGGACRIDGAPLSGVNTEAGLSLPGGRADALEAALENVAIGLEVRGVPRGEARERAARWLARVGLGAFGERYPHQLSGGQRKRVALAQVLILRAEAPADGRALRAARRADPAADGRDAAAALVGGQEGGDLHHPRPGGGDLARRTAW